MRQVEKMFLRKTERGEMDPMRGRAPIVVTNDVTCLALRLAGKPCQGSGRLASFIYITDVFVQPGTPLSLPSKFRT